jgi:hypothetical protein
MYTFEGAALGQQAPFRKTPGKGMEAIILMMSCRGTSHGGGSLLEETLKRFGNTEKIICYSEGNLPGSNGKK